MRTVRFAADPEAVKAPSCSLSPGSIRERGVEWTTLRDRHMIDRQRIGDTLTSTGGQRRCPNYADWSRRSTNAAPSSRSS